MASPYGSKMRRSTAGSVGGAGVFATQRISGGELVQPVDPLIAMPDNVHIAETCYRCLLWIPYETHGQENMTNAYSSAKLLRCKGCTVVRYCSVDCQKADWKNGHKHECPIYKGVLDRGIIPVTVRVMIRLLHLKKFGLITTEVWHSVEAMEGHVTKFKADGGMPWERVCRMAMGAANYAQALREDAVRELYCRFFINAFNAVTQTFDPVGNTFDPTIASLNHSCDPNTVLVFDKRKVNIRSLRDIAKDEELTISYIDNTNPAWYRKQELRERYFFECKCLACSSAEPAPSEEYQRIFIDQVSLGKKCQELLTNYSDTPASIDLLIAQQTQNLRTHCRPLSPSWIQPKPLLHYTIAQACISSGKWDKALLHLVTLYVTSDAVIYKVPYHPVRVCRNFTLAMVLLEVSATNPGAFAIDYTTLLYGILVEVEGNVDKSHGANSTFAQIVKRKKQEVETDIGIDGGGDVKKWLGKGLGTIPGLKAEVGKLEKIVNDFEDDLQKSLALEETNKMSEMAI